MQRRHSQRECQAHSWSSVEHSPSLAGLVQLQIGLIRTYPNKINISFISQCDLCTILHLYDM